MKKDEFLKIVRSKMKADPTPEELAYFESMGEAIERAFSAEGVERKKQIEDLTAMIGSVEQGKSIAEVIRGLATEVHNLKENAKRGLSDNDKFALRKMLDEKKDEILAARNSNSKWAIEFRAVRGAAAMMTSTNMMTGAQAFNNPNVFQDTELVIIRYPANFIIDAIGGRQVGTVPKMWEHTEQADEHTNSVGLTAESGEKNKYSASFEKKYSERKKYAGRIEFTSEMEMDFDQLFLEVVLMFENQVIRKWNAGVQADILAWTPAYTSTGLDGFFISPGIMQVIQAGKLHVSNKFYNPDMVFINPTDAIKATIIQDADGDMKFIPASEVFAGLRVFESTNIPEGTIVIGDSTVIQEQHSAFIMRRGVYGDQLIHNQETIIGEIFSNLRLTERSKVGFVKLNVDTVLTQLTKLVA
jgi:hypothetical protein